MEYKILYPEAFPIVSMHLHRGEAIKAESDAMIAMSPTIDVEGKREGSLLGGLARKFLSGESFFMQRLVASRGDGDVLFAHALPGGILDVDLDGSYGLIVEQGGFGSQSAVPIGREILEAAFHVGRYAPDAQQQDASAGK